MVRVLPQPSGMDAFLVGAWESCDSIALRYPGKTGRQLQNITRRTYVQNECEPHELFTKSAEPSLVAHPPQRHIMKDHVLRYRKIVRKDGRLVGGRGEVVVIAMGEPPGEKDWIICGQHVATAFYEEHAENKENPQILATIEDGIKVTRLYPKTPDDVVRFFRDDNNYLNKVKGASRTFLEKLDDVPKVTAVIQKAGGDEEEDAEATAAIAAESKKDMSTYDKIINDTLSQVFPDMYDNADQFKTARKYMGRPPRGKSTTTSKS